MTSLKKRMMWLACVGACVASLAGLALAQKSDFDRAVGGSGCKLIPDTSYNNYSSLRSQCHSNYDKQSDWCTGEREKGCGDLKKEEPADREEAKKRKEIAEECLKHRRAVRKVFDEVVSKLDGEREAEIKPLAEKISERIKATFDGHDRAISDTERRRDKCADKM